MIGNNLNTLGSAHVVILVINLPRDLNIPFFQCLDNYLVVSFYNYLVKAVMNFRRLPIVCAATLMEALSKCVAPALSNLPIQSWTTKPPATDELVSDTSKLSLTNHRGGECHITRWNEVVRSGGPRRQVSIDM